MPWLIAAAIALLTAAGVALGRGLFPCRRGQTPYCRKCRYNLSGNTSGRCPECGAGTSNPILGERVRRPRWIVAGAVCAALGLTAIGTGIYARIRGINWYTHRPTAWVLQDAQSISGTLACQAADELSRRMVRDRLSASQKSALADVCLTEQARGEIRGRVTARLNQTLATLYRQDVLDASQKRRFYDQLVSATISARPVCLVAEPCPVQMMIHMRAPWQLFSFRVLAGPLRTNGRVVGRHAAKQGEEPGIDMERDFGTVTWPLSDSADGLSLGRNEITWNLLVRISELPAAPGSSPVVVHTYESQLRATTTAVDDETAEGIRTVSSPELDHAVARSVEFSGLAKEEALRDMRLDWGVSMRAPLPVGLSFAMYVEYDGREQSLGYLAAPRETTLALLGGSPFLRRPHADRVTVILRADKGGARRELDMYEIWGGELRFEDIPVGPAWSKPTSRPYYHGKLVPRHPE